MMYLWSDEQNIFSLTDKTNLVEMQRQFWQQAITAAGTARSFTRTEDGLYPTLLRAAHLADIHVINEAKESEREVKFLVKNNIQ